MGVRFSLPAQKLKILDFLSGVFSFLFNGGRIESRSARSGAKSEGNHSEREAGSRVLGARRVYSLEHT